MSNGIEVIQNKFLKLVWILLNRDWTNELVIIGVIILAGIDLHQGKGASHQLANTVAGGLIGYLTRAVQEGAKETARILNFPASPPRKEEEQTEIE